MIVREMDGGSLLCIPQTTHALMAAEFVRHWGNEAFTPPRPYAAVMMAIAQHDGGWYEWEQAARLQRDGRPMDFITHTDQREKTRLWQRGIDRAYAQHPYAALLISRHASALYEGFLAQDAYEEVNRSEVNRFLAEQRQLAERVQTVLGDQPDYAWALQPAVLRANTQLLQFGDRAALQIGVPWSDEAVLGPVPLDYSGQSEHLTMAFDDMTVHFDPWPYSERTFDVHMEGYLLHRSAFQTEDTYHQALNEASLVLYAWQVSIK